VWSRLPQKKSNLGNLNPRSTHAQPNILFDEGQIVKGKLVIYDLQANMWASGIQFHGFFCYAAGMKNERLLELIEQINTGQLSRNKDFEAFKDPTVRDARDRQFRLQTLKRILGQAQRVTLQLDRVDHWKLTCRFPEWDFIWSAFLRDFEVKLLREDPEISKIMS